MDLALVLIDTNTVVCHLKLCSYIFFCNDSSFFLVVEEYEYLKADSA